MNQPKGDDKHHSKIRHSEAVRHVVNDILDGATYSVLFQKLTEDEYGLDYKYSQSMAQKIITEARKRMKEDYKEALPQMRETLTNICMDILSEAKQIGDRMNALKAVDYVAKLTGAYTPEQKEVTVKEMTIDFNLLNNETEHQGN